MHSFLVDGVLFVALLLSCLRLFAMHRALEELRAYHRDYQAAFEKTAIALAAVRAVLSETNSRERDLSKRLAALIEETRATTSETGPRRAMLDETRWGAGEQFPGVAESERKEVRVGTPSIARTPHAPFAFCRRVGRSMTEAVAMLEGQN